MKLHGRRIIYSSVDWITTENVVDVIRKAMSTHELNKKEIEYLDKYAKGDQPILNRIKEIRPEINNKIVENHALEILNFKVGFQFGEPVQYVRRGDCNVDENEADSNAVAQLNEFMQLDNKASKDRELAEWFSKCGVAYKAALPSEEGADRPFETYVLDPKQTFIIYKNDFSHKPLLAVSYYSDIDTNGVESARKYTAYTNDYVFTYEESFKENISPEIKSSINPIGVIPIVEYRNNPDMMGSYEPVLPLCDAINTLSSNTVDGVEQTIQSLLWFDNCELVEGGMKELREAGAIQTKSEPNRPANIKAINAELSQSETQVTKDDLYQKMLTIASVPDRRASAGGNTGQALIIGEGWVMAESAAKALEPLFIESEKQLLRVILAICDDPKEKTVTEELRKLKLHDIDVKFTRNKTDNLLVKTEALMNLLSSGIHPRIAITYCGLFGDPEQVYQDSISTIKAKQGEKNLQTTNVDNSDPLTDEVLSLIDKLNGGADNGNS